MPDDRRREHQQRDGDRDNLPQRPSIRRTRQPGERQRQVPRIGVDDDERESPEYVEFLEMADRYPEVRLDTTMVFTDFSEWVTPFPAGSLPRLADLQERILFGSDFPNIPYPYPHALESLARLDLGNDWLRAVCHDNAAQLFDL